MKETKKRRAFTVDRDERNRRRRALRRVEHTHSITRKDGDVIESKREFETSVEHAESRQIVVEMAQAFIGTVEFYKAEHGGANSHKEAVKQAMSLDEFRRKQVEGLQPEKVSWSHIGAVAQASMEDGLELWMRIREAADDELEGGRRAAKVTGDNREPYELAQFLAIRDAFADQWQPQGGIESAMIDMLTVSFSLQLYWSTIAHERAMRAMTTS